MSQSSCLTRRKLKITYHVYHSQGYSIRLILLLCLCWVYLNVYKCTYICFHLLEISNFLATRSLLCLLALHPNRDVGKQEKSPTVVPLSHLSSAFPKEWCDICLSFRGRGESLKLSKNEPCLDIYTVKSDQPRYLWDILVKLESLDSSDKLR